MLYKELEEMQHYVEQLDLCLSAIHQLAESILSHPAKNYRLTFKNYTFDLFHPFDKDEKIQVANMRRKYIKLLLQHIMKNRINNIQKSYNAKIYRALFALCYGQDPKDHQIKKSAIEGAYKVHDEKDQIYGKQRPLDQEAYQVKMQDQKVVFKEETDGQ